MLYLRKKSLPVITLTCDIKKKRKNQTEYEMSENYELQYD
jgi:hypothetical protein